MEDRIIEFYIYIVMISFVSQQAIFYLFLERVGLSNKLDEPKFFGRKPWANPLNIFDQYSNDPNLSDRKLTHLRTFKVWFTLNLILLFAGTPLIAIIQIAISSSGQ